MLVGRDRKNKNWREQESTRAGSQGWEGVGTQRPRLKKHVRTKEAVHSVLTGLKVARVGVEAGGA